MIKIIKAAKNEIDFDQNLLSSNGLPILGCINPPLRSACAMSHAHGTRPPHTTAREATAVASPVTPGRHAMIAPVLAGRFFDAVLRVYSVVSSTSLSVDSRCIARLRPNTTE